MTGSILNLSGYSVEHIDETEYDYHVHAVTLKPRFACAHCGSTDATSCGTHEQLLRDLPMHGKRVGIYVLGRRFRCNVCSTTGMEKLPHVSERRAMTDRLERWMGKQSLERTFAAVADEVGVDERTVRNVFRDHAADLERDFRFETPRWLGICKRA